MCARHRLRAAAALIQCAQLFPSLHSRVKRCVNLTDRETWPSGGFVVGGFVLPRINPTIVQFLLGKVCTVYHRYVALYTGLKILNKFDVFLLDLCSIVLCEVDDSFRRRRGLALPRGWKVSRSQFWTFELKYSIDIWWFAVWTGCGLWFLWVGWIFDGGEFVWIENC